MSRELIKTSEAEDDKKEFLRIPDMITKLNLKSRKQLWDRRKKGLVPKPLYNSPPTWRAQDVDAFYDKMANTENS